MDIADVTWDENLPKMVFITLDNDLAGDDEPVVRLVGPLDDAAGNSTGTGEVEAADGIAPMVSVSVDASGDTVTVLVSADENSRNPTRSSGRHGAQSSSRTMTATRRAAGTPSEPRPSGR